MENFTPLNFERLKTVKNPKKKKLYLLAGIGSLLVLVLLTGFYINKTLITIQQRAAALEFKCDQPNQKWATDLDLIKDKGKVLSGQGIPFFDPGGPTFKIQVPEGYRVVSIGCYDCDHYGDTSGRGWKIIWDGGSIDAITNNNTWKSWDTDITGVNEILFDGGGDSHGANACVVLPSLVSPSPTPTVVQPTVTTPTPTETQPTITPSPTPTQPQEPTLTPTPTETVAPNPTITSSPTPTPTTLFTLTPTPTSELAPTDTPPSSPTPTETVLVAATSTPAAGEPTTVAKVTEIPPAGIATFGKIFAFVSLAIIFLGLIL